MADRSWLVLYSPVTPLLSVLHIASSIAMDERLIQPIQQTKGRQMIDPDITKMATMEPVPNLRGPRAPTWTDRTVWDGQTATTVRTTAVQAMDTILTVRDIPGGQPVFIQLLEVSHPTRL